MTPLLSCEQVSKSYGDGPLAETALVDVSLQFRRGQSCLFMGPSGSGKTTLLSILGCLLMPTAGHIAIDGQPVPKSSANRLVAYRRDRIGFVFQHSQLLPFLTVEDNLRIPGQNFGLTRQQAIDRIGRLASSLGVSECLARRPHALSGGQRQRIAVARALIHRPPIILADEPTASLDWNNGQAVVQLLLQNARMANSVLIVVSHDTRLIPQFDRILHMDSGRVRES